VKMSRALRFVPEGGALVEVTVRTVQSRLLLRPGGAVNEIILGVLGRAQRRYAVRCSFVVFLSNHFHLLLWVQDALQLSRFMQYVDGNIARKVGKLVDWPHGLWSRRYQAILVSNEEKAQVARLRYSLSHGVKEGLVGRLSEWPGVHSLRAILEDKPLKGLWFNQTQEYAARNRGEEYNRLKYATEEELVLTQLPCWEHLSREEYRDRIASLVEEIEAEGRAKRELTGIPAVGVAEIVKQSRHSRPNQSKRSPAPQFHAATKSVRKVMWAAYATFVAAFREAAERLKAGDRLASFPIGSFPPGMPFVSACPAMPP
jgi:hypothetical protein